MGVPSLPPLAREPLRARRARGMPRMLRARLASPSQGSAGATHGLDGDEADADERREAAAEQARSGGGRQSHPSLGCSAKHAHSGLLTTPHSLGVI
jgi:hypothetical protein